MVSVLIIAE